MQDARCRNRQLGRGPRRASRVHAAALRLHSAAGADAGGIAAARHTEVEAAPPLLRVAGAELASLLAAPDPPGRRGSGAAGQRPDTKPQAGQLTARTARAERAEEGTPVADYGVISDVSASLVTLLDQDPRRPQLNARAQLGDLSGAAVVAVLDQAPDDPDTRFQLAVLDAMVGALDKECAALRSLVTKGSDHADEVLSLARPLRE